MTNEAEALKKEISHLRHEFNMLRHRSHVVEVYALRAYVLAMAQGRRGVQAIDASVAATVQGLEADAQTLESVSLSDDFGKPWSDARRAQYADEFREMIEEMKSFVTSQRDILRNAHRKPGEK